MFRWIIGSSLQFRFLVMAVGVALLVFGSQQLRKMPVDVFPEFALPKIEIQTLPAAGTESVRPRVWLATGTGSEC